MNQFRYSPIFLGRDSVHILILIVALVNTRFRFRECMMIAKGLHSSNNNAQTIKTLEIESPSLQKSLDFFADFCRY